MDPNILKRLKLFASLSEEECLQIASLGHEISVPSGEVFIEDGSIGTSFFLLLFGRVEVKKGEVHIATREPGAILGEMSLFNKNKRTAQAVATERATLLEIETSKFWPLLLHNEPAAVKMMESLGRIMAERIQEQDADILSRIAKSEQNMAILAQDFAHVKKEMMADWALKYHTIGRPGKLSIAATKAACTAADLSVAYSPGVAEPCLAIKQNEERAYDYTTKAQLVGVVTNGSAVLGLGNIGPTAAKPVMEGKAILFKSFADVDAFDIEVDELDPERFIDIVCSLAPTFGGINLEDIRSPECFYIEEECKRRLDIPVFHDDQHGTAIIAGAGLLNALELIGKDIQNVRVVFSGAGAAGFACAKYFLNLGVSSKNLIMADIKGVIYKGRGDGNYLEEVAVKTECRILAEAIKEADVFVGVSTANVLTPEMLMSMNQDPIVFAMANPVPEIDYQVAIQTRNDVIIGTGRSDYPNQINNVIAFPYIFRGALDVRARGINEEMKQAASSAIALLAREPVTADSGFDSEGLSFGRKYIIPKPFDRRLLIYVASAVAEAAMKTGMARKAIDIGDYKHRLSRLSLMQRG